MAFTVDERHRLHALYAQSNRVTLALHVLSPLLARSWLGLIRPVPSFLVPVKRGLQSEDLHPPRGVAGSGFRLLPRIPHCCPLGGQRWPRGGPGRVSVPIRLDILSDQLPVIGLVSHYPTNHLIGRGLLPERRRAVGDFPRGASAPRAHAVLPTLLGWLSPAWGQITHVILDRLPLCRRCRAGVVRLACVRHAASVHPEPGSNSHKLIALAVIASSRLLRCPLPIPVVTSGRRVY